MAVETSGLPPALAELVTDLEARIDAAFADYSRRAAGADARGDSAQVQRLQCEFARAVAPMQRQILQILALLPTMPPAFFRTADEVATLRADSLKARR